eukprot:CAMPEP_0185300476 /NCGR_PEP_ID=MMETSP1363-20130426/12051_1 /TAXON_ID=38817 /ORGANISM="Gephyrocapsa oceanica, Strain RCC1303" /LENGTH=102 /DNA_ID=CAMNT_0027897439 /DNA_START=136 /DNA_END=445 /DNA_ORIENTATION=-
MRPLRLAQGGVRNRLCRGELEAPPPRALISSAARALDFHDLHREDEAVAASNFGRAATVAVGEVGWDVHLPLVTLDHELHCLSPPLDDLVRRKGGRAATVVA